MKICTHNVLKLKSLSALMILLILTASCSSDHQPDSVTNTTSEVDNKDCDEGDSYESSDFTYECIQGAWVLTSEDKASLTSDPGEGELSIVTLSHANKTREYLLYIPVSYDGSVDVPLMLNFHGFGGTMEGHMNSANMRTLADSKNFILVYPQGSLLEGSSHWNANLPSSDNKSSADDLGFIGALIDDLASNYQVDSDRVYASGYSNGGFMSYGLACHLNNKIAAVAGVSGTMIDIENCDPTNKIAVMALHGTADGVVPYNGGNGFSSVDETLNFWTTFNETSDTPTFEEFDDNGITIEHYSYSDSEGDVLVEHFKIVEGSHVWFENDFDGSNTNQLIWDFVSQWDINGKI